MGNRVKNRADKRRDKQEKKQLLAAERKERPVKAKESKPPKPKKEKPTKEAKQKPEKPQKVTKVQKVKPAPMKSGKKKQPTTLPTPEVKGKRIADEPVKVDKDLVLALQVNQYPAKILSVMLAMLGMSGLLVVSNGFGYLVDGVYNTTGDSRGTTFIFGMLVVMAGIAISVVFIRLALSLIRAVESNSKMRIRKTSLRSFLSSLAVVIYVLFISSAPITGWASFVAAFLVVMSFAAVLAYASNRSTVLDKYWEDEDYVSAQIKKVKALDDNPFITGYDDDEDYSTDFKGW